MKLELHLIQNFAPNNLNRDDANAPKDTEFGGYRRARISSQAFKRSMRLLFKELADQNQKPGLMAIRSRKFVSKFVEQLVAQGKDPKMAFTVAISVLGGLGFTVKLDEKKEDNESEEDHLKKLILSAQLEYLIFLGESEIDKIVSITLEHWDELAKEADKFKNKKELTAKELKALQKKSFDKKIQKQLKEAIDGGRAIDLALFGRMVADVPDFNRDAASQVAHAISTNRVSMEMDFYTAIDDLQTDSDTGAGMMGTVEFNSSCFYRYLNIDIDQLLTNLGQDTELAKLAVEWVLQAAIEAIPSGKQNSMAAHNPPSFVMSVVRSAGTSISLANAFCKPVRPSESNSLSERSILALADYWMKIDKVYGSDGIVGSGFFQIEDSNPKSLEECSQPVLDLKTKKDLITKTVEWIGL